MNTGILCSLMMSDANECLNFPPLISNIENISAITDFLGDFHDLCNSISMLEERIGNIVNEDELEFLNTLKIKWQKKREKIRDQILSKFRKFHLFFSAQTPSTSNPTGENSK